MIIQCNSEGYGIYCIRNTKNGRTYVGCTERNFLERFKEHSKRLKNGITNFNLKHYSEDFLLEYLKYGEESFVFESLYEAIDRKEDLRKKETYFITLLKSVELGYNRVFKTSNELTYVFYDIYGNYVKEQLSSNKNLKSTAKRNRDAGNIGAVLYNKEFYVLSYDLKNGGLIKNKIKVLKNPLEVLTLVFDKDLNLVLKTPKREEAMNFINEKLGYISLDRSATLASAIRTYRFIDGKYIAILAKDLLEFIKIIENKKQRAEKYKINKNNLWKLKELMI